MKMFALLALLLIAGCEVGEEPEKSSDDIRHFDSQPVTGTDHNRIQAICMAIDYNKNRLGTLVGSEYIYKYAQRGCSGNIPALEDVKVTLDYLSGDYSFNSHGVTFGFPVVETPESGSLKEICEKISSLENPIRTSLSGAIWMSTADSSDCSSSGDAYCIQLDKGAYIDEYNYKITGSEWIKVQISGVKTGFVTERAMLSNTNCPAGQFIVKKAVLK